MKKKVNIFKIKAKIIHAIRLVVVLFRTKPLYLSLLLISASIFIFSIYKFIDKFVLNKSLAAGDTSISWNFASSGDYTLSDSSLIEVSSNAARLKSREYSSDANTSLLYHLNESSGNPTDSSSNANAGTISNVTYSTGKFSNAASFNGDTTQIEVTDSSSLSFTSTNTLEAWTKLNSSFSEGSSNQRQGIFDKGDYQLYFSNETGKLVYELANSSATTLDLVGGGSYTSPWDHNGRANTDANTLMGSNYFVGTGVSTGDAEVWQWNGTVWSKIGGDAINSSWTINTYEGVYALANDGTNVYAGLGNTAGDGEVWKWNGSTWSKIGGDGVNSGWAAGFAEVVYALYWDNTYLYAALGNSTQDAEVWRWNGSTWTKIGGDGVNSSWNTSYEITYSLAGDGTNIYAGLGSTAGDAEVWRWNGSAWTKIGGDAINSSWADATYELVYSLFYQGSTLYAGLGNTANDAEVWRWNGSAWSQIGGDSLNSGWTTNYEAVYSIVGDGTNIYAGLGNSAGDDELWRWNGSAWTKIGGDALSSSFSSNHTIVAAMAYGSSTLYVAVVSGSTNYSAQVWTYVGSTWAQIGGDDINKSWGHRGLQTVETMNVAGNYLYAGTGNTLAGNAAIWQFDGTNWIIVGGQGVNSSWTPFTYENTMAMVSYNSDLHVGLGVTAGDAEVWKWNESAWSKIGGDGLNSSWNTVYEEVSAMAVLDSTLYAGTGNTAGDAEVYSWNGTIWTKIGGDGLNSSWNTVYERVTSLIVYNGNLYAGLGSSAGDAEVWKWSGSAWSQIGGDTLNSSWANATFEQVDSMIIYKNLLAVGLGTSADDAEVWTYNGSVWSLIGGDNANSSWDASTYERVRTLVTYNGDLYAGLGSTAGDGEVWKYNGSTWSQIAGDNLNGGWGINTIEDVPSFSVYKGKLYIGTGISANADANIWVYGNNSYLESATTSFNTDWRHIAATYDGSTMEIFINGVLDNSTSTSVTIPNSTRSLLIGATYAGREAGKPRGSFDGLIDEARISSTAREIPDLITSAYTSDAQTVKPNSAVMTSQIKNWEEFIVTEGGVGTVTYRLSSDGGTTWKYWNGSAWATSSAISDSNSASVINTNIPTFPVTSSGILWQAVLDGNGEQQASVSAVEITATADLTSPTAPDSLTALSASGGTSITTNTWYSHSAPYFSWTGATDTGGSGVSGYYVYFGTSSSADPQTAGNFQAGNTYTVASPVSGSTYYLRIKSKDNAQNVSSTWAAFIYKFDATSPSNPSAIAVSPTGYASTNSFTFSWPAGSDTGAGLAGYQYKTGAASGPLSDWSATTTDTSVVVADAAYQDDENIFYLRTIDTAGNVNPTILQVSYYFAGEGPSAPQYLSVTPSSNTTNSFAFSWQAPSSFGGNASDLTYCYTVNSFPTSNTCTFTSAGATSLSASSFATQVGLNTFYIVAKNSDAAGGAINYGAYTSVSFTANTSAPGIPLNNDIADISIKSTSTWRLTISWNTPSNIGSGVSEYQIYRSTNNSTYTFLANTSGSAYVDTGLSQQLYYYKVRACDNVENCGAFTSEVSMLPTGKYTDAASLSSDPVVSNITTKKATISWSTDRDSDSKIQYGTSSDDYFDEEPSNSTQTTDHTISLSSLSPGTTYYFKAKWTDEDGNTGISDEVSFKTEPAPIIKDAVIKSLGISSALIQFTVTGASKVKVYYGETTAFGGLQEVTTSTAESTYNILLSDLKDGTKYYYRLNPIDSETTEYENQINSFETLPRPKISEVRLQQVKGTAQPTVLVSWTTNTETSSIATFYPEGNPADARDEVNVALIKGEHKLLLKGLKPQTVYSLIVKGRDKIGNEAQSEVNRFTTSTDTRPPLISNLKIEGNVSKAGDGSQLAQLIVSWDTDEISMSQVEFGEGTGTTYSQKTQLDANLTYNHIVVISGLQTSRAYHLRALSKDSAGNEVASIDTVTITPKSTDNALDLVVSNLSEAFGFIKNAN